MKRIVIAIVLLALVAAAGVTAPVKAQGKPFAGVKIVVATQTGFSIAGPVEKLRTGWEDKTGGTVEVQTFPFGDLFPKLRDAFATGSSAFDMIIFAPDWAGDIMGPGYLLPVPDEINKKVEIDDVLPAYRDRLLKWGGVQYGIPYDGDTFLAYYRRDLIENKDYAAQYKAKYNMDLRAPQTWKEWAQIAEFFNDPDGKQPWSSGKPFYGDIEAMQRNGQAYWTFIARAGAYAKYPGDPSMFFDVDTMKPRVNNPGWVKALEEYVAIKQFGPPGMENFQVGDVRSKFPGGLTALGLDWADVGTLCQDPKVSVIKGKCGTVVLPGSQMVFNPKTGKWEDLGKISHAPYLAFGGWTIGVSKFSKHPDAAFDFAAYMGSKDMAAVLDVMPDSGVNPNRKSVLENTDLWVKQAGLDPTDAKEYLAAIRQTIEDPNNIIDLRVPGAFQYFDALDAGVTKAIAGELKPQEALDQVAKNWDQITDNLGRDKQKKYYADSLNLPAK